MAGSVNGGSLAARLELLARHLDIFESPGFTFGDWVPSWTDADGVIHLGWYRFSPAAEAFLADVGAGDWVTPFDWMTWLGTPEGQTLAGDPSAVGRATPEDLGKLLTSLVRGERFGDGTLANAFDSGMLTAIARRAGELRAAEPYEAQEPDRSIDTDDA
jgi:hypothetical protein